MSQLAAREGERKRDRRVKATVNEGRRKQAMMEAQKQERRMMSQYWRPEGERKRDRMRVGTCGRLLYGIVGNVNRRGRPPMRSYQNVHGSLYDSYADNDKSYLDLSM